MDLGKMLYKGIETYHGHDKNRFETKIGGKMARNVDFSNISKNPIHFQFDIKNMSLQWDGGGGGGE